MNASALLTKGFCRCCISTTAELIPMKNGSFVFQSNILNISDVYVGLSGIENWIPALWDSEPSICEMCTAQLQNAYIFLEQIKVADAALRAMFQQQHQQPSTSANFEPKSLIVPKTEVDVEPPIETYQISSDEDSVDVPIKVEEYKIMNFDMSNTFSCNAIENDLQTTTITQPEPDPNIKDMVEDKFDLFNVYIKQEDESAGMTVEGATSFICAGCNRRYECKKKLLAHLYEYHFPDLTD